MTEMWPQKQSLLVEICGYRSNHALKALALRTVKTLDLGAGWWGSLCLYSGQQRLSPENKGDYRRQRPARFSAQSSLSEHAADPHDAAMKSIAHSKDARRNPGRQPSRSARSGQVVSNVRFRPRTWSQGERRASPSKHAQRELAQLAELFGTSPVCISSQSRRRRLSASEGGEHGRRSSMAG